MEVFQDAHQNLLFPECDLYKSNVFYIHEKKCGSVFREKKKSIAILTHFFDTPALSWLLLNQLGENKDI